MCIRETTAEERRAIENAVDHKKPYGNFEE